MRVRHMAVYVGGRKFAMASNVEYNINMNSNRLVADEGDIGSTDGPPQTTVTCDAINPVAGTGMSLDKKMLRNERVDLLLYPVEGNAHSLVDVKINSANFTGEAAGGTNTSRWEFMGGEPKPVSLPV